MKADCVHCWLDWVWRWIGRRSSPQVSVASQSSWWFSFLATTCRATMIERLTHSLPRFFCWWSLLSLPHPLLLALPHSSPSSDRYAAQSRWENRIPCVPFPSVHLNRAEVHVYIHTCVCVYIKAGKRFELLCSEGMWRVPSRRRPAGQLFGFQTTRITSLRLANDRAPVCHNRSPRSPAESAALLSRSNCSPSRCRLRRMSPISNWIAWPFSTLITRARDDAQSLLSTAHGSIGYWSFLQPSGHGRPCWFSA